VFLWIGIPVMSLSGLSTPALQGLMTRRIKFADQGQLQGALGSVTAVSQMVGPGVFSFAFAYSVATQAAPGIPFYIAGFLLIIAAFIVFQVNAAQKS
jgi:DHA1 family tetracycline resistance protein-like MFS transporter